MLWLHVRNFDQNFADVICQSPKDGVKSYQAGTEQFAISCVLVSWEADGSWFKTRSLREQDVVSVREVNAGDLASLRVLADSRNYLWVFIQRVY